MKLKISEGIKTILDRYDEMKLKYLKDPSCLRFKNQESFYHSAFFSYEFYVFSCHKLLLSEGVD
jgi:hypothetical protein